jgi:predicted transcriptional regulator
MNPTSERIVGDVMTRNVVSVKEDTDLTDAIRIMNRECLSILPVVDRADKICGILSTSDLIASTYNLQADVSVLTFVSEAVRKTLVEALTEDTGSQSVSSVMSDHVESISPQDNLGHAARLMTENSIHHLLVLDQSGKPVGILSTSDIVRSVGYQ